MKRLYFLTIILLLMAGCSKNNSSWEDVKTTGRSLNKSIDNTFGKPYNAHQMGEDSFAALEDEFIPLSDRDLRLQLTSERAIPQPKVVPGSVGSGIPELDKFQAPPAELAELFKHIHFATDDYIVRSRESMMIIEKIASFLREHPNIYLVIEGHCDERASAAYNMALGTRRSNSVRALLTKFGVDSNHLYTTSYGKEKPLALGHAEEDWQINRRADFKMHSKQ